MSELPLFPLPETVVFPGMTVPLYIFEERYKHMIRECLEQDQRQFVIVLAKAISDIGDVGESFYKVGSIMQVMAASENEDGTYNIFAHGQARCYTEITRRVDISETDGSSRPLFYTKDLPFALERGDPNLELVTAWDTLDSFREYAKIFFAFDARKQIEEALPEDLMYQASFICANIRVPSASRQVLLEAPSLTARFQLAQKLMRERIAAHKPSPDA